MLCEWPPFVPEDHVPIRAKCEHRATSLTLSFGALAKPIVQQVQEQGISCGYEISPFQADADAITRLYIRGVLRESEKERLRKKLLQNIVAFLDGRRRGRSVRLSMPLKRAEKRRDTEGQS